METYEKYNIILLGKTGHGKSTLCNLLSNSTKFRVGHDTKSTTQEIETSEIINEENKVKLNIIDTPGFSDSGGADKDLIHINALIKYLEDKSKPRIHAILIVFSIQEPKMDNSIKEFLRQICALFPLPDFWDHIIIFYTRFFGQEKSELDDLRDRALSFKDDFIKLSEEIAKKLPINKLTKDKELKYVLNNYNILSKDKKISELNLKNSKENIKKVINWIKKMKIIYKELAEVYDKYTKVNDSISGNSKIITYKHQKIKKYKDFDNTIYESPFDVKNVTIRIEPSIETKIIKNNGGEKKTQQIKKYEYFMDEKKMSNKQIEEIICKNDLKKEEIIEEREEKLKTEIVKKGNRQSKKQYTEVLVTKNGKTETSTENETIIEEFDVIEDQDWKLDDKLSKEKNKIYHRYTNKVNYDKNNSTTTIKLKVQTKEEKDEGNNTKRIIIKQYDIQNNDIKNKNNEKLLAEYTEEEKTIIDDKDYDKNKNIGKINYSIEIERKLIKKDPSFSMPTLNEVIKNYTEDYFAGSELKTETLLENDNLYEITYYDIYKKNSLAPKELIPTNYKEIQSKNEKNMLFEFRDKEFEKDGKLYKQNYKVFYINQNGKKVDKSEEPAGEATEIIIKKEKKIETEPEEAKIEKLKSLNQYPIQYKKNYFEIESNTDRKKKELLKSENIMITKEHFVEIIKRGEFNFKEEYDKEIYYIDEVKDENMIKLAPKLNYKSERVSKKIVEKKEEKRRGKKISRKFKLFSKNEHTYNIEKRLVLIFDDGTIEYTEWTDGGVEIFNYDE